MDSLKNKKLSLNKFLIKVFPFDSPFQREEFTLFHNFIKFLALRFSFILYRLNISANFLSFISVLIAIPSFWLLINGFYENNFQELLYGYFLVILILFIDFADGPLSKINNYEFAAGDNLDNLPPDVVKAGIFIYLGLISGNLVISIISFITAVISLVYIPKSVNMIQKNRSWFLRIYSSKLSPIGFRTIFLFVLPVQLFLISFFNIASTYFAILFTFSSFIFSILWIIFTMEDNSRKIQ